jgi:hypothetical protein
MHTSYTNVKKPADVEALNRGLYSKKSSRVYLVVQRIFILGFIV